MGILEKIWFFFKDPIYFRITPLSVYITNNIVKRIWYGRLKISDPSEGHMHCDVLVSGRNDVYYNSCRAQPLSVTLRIRLYNHKTVSVLTCLRHVRGSAESCVVFDCINNKKKQYCNYWNSLYAERLSYPPPPPPSL